MTDKTKRLFREHIKDNTYLVGEVYYEIGGMNYFTGQVAQRGYYFSVCPVRESNGMSTISAFSGTKLFLEPAKRFSKKDLACITPSSKQLEDLKAHVKAKNNMGA